MDAWTSGSTTEMDPTGLRNLAPLPPPPPVRVHGDLHVKDNEGDGGGRANGRKNEILMHRESLHPRNIIQGGSSRCMYHTFL